MSLQIVPYNNAMRLGQGYNSYTQTICIDDAVIIDPKREENVVNNAGTTMKMLAQETGVLSALERMPGLASSSTSSNSATASPVGFTSSGAIRLEESSSRSSATLSLKKQGPPDSADLSQSAGSKPPDPKQRAAEQKAARDQAAETFKNAMSKDEMKAKFGDNAARVTELIAQNTQAVRRAKGEQELPWTAAEARGPAQTVTYSSKFINKLSEITDEMSISGKLSITYGAIGGSGGGSFLDADKFYDSDLAYMVSVRVVSQTINWKDPLVFNPLRSCMRDQDKFNNTFGDSWISGFLEGGVFYAVVLIKVHNTNKKRDIEAELKVALTAGPVEVSAQGNVKLAEENIKNNTEQSCYVMWCGGGNIKPYDEEWSISSVKAAAARFPALVGLFPQRTHAILSKYTTLRSYLMLKPVTLSPLRYEVAQLYTNILLDAYMEYSAMAKRLSANIADIQAGLKEFQEADAAVRPPLSSALVKARLSPFPATLTGLDKARQAIRNQMNQIVAEVEILTATPEVASDPDRRQPYVGPISFAALLPKVEICATRKRWNAAPLDVKRINTVVETTSEASSDKTDEGSPPLFNPKPTPLRLSAAEQAKLTDLEWKSYGIGSVYQVTAPIGDSDEGAPFCTLDYAQSEESIVEIAAIAAPDGKLSSIVVGYDNGLICTFGAPVQQTDLDSTPKSRKLVGIEPVGERIRSVTIQVMRYTDTVDQHTQRVVGLSMLMSQERQIEALYQPSSLGEGVIHSETFTAPEGAFKLSGLWGQMRDSGERAGISRLGLIWGPATSSLLAPDAGTKQPKTFGSVSQTTFLNTVGSGLATVKYPYTLLDRPRLIIAPHYYKALAESQATMDTEMMDRLHFSVHVDRVDKKSFTAQGFTAVAKTRHEGDPLFCYWMVIPELESCVIDCGEADVQSGKPLPVSFRRAYAEGVIPQVRCWIMAIDARPRTVGTVANPGGSVHIEARVVPDSCTRQGFTLAVEVSDDTVLESIKLGWIAHTKPESANADFVSGDILFQDLNGQLRQEIKLESTLRGTPVSKFMGMNEIHVDTTHLPRFSTTILPETSGDALHLNITPFAPCRIKRLGMTWILSM